MDIKKLKNKHTNKDLVILTCGPSLTEYDKDLICKFLENKIVICVKESIIEYKNYADYFICNTTRERRYNFVDKTIKLYQRKNTTGENKYDIFLNEDLPFSKNRQLLRIKNFEKYNFENNIKRPWGPGILYESVFYLCLYMGIKNVYTIGWDLIDINNPTVITHYFDNYKTKDYKKSKVWSIKDFKKDGHLEEMKMVNKNIPFMYNYFKNKGMNIFVVGKKSYVNSKIPRIYL